MTVETLKQLEDNVAMSFGYVKKDVLSVNDSVNDLHEQIQHLSMNNAMLLDKVMALEKLVSGKTKIVEKKELEFYDVKAKQKFTTKDYVIKNIKGRKFAIAKSPSGSKSYRIIGSSKKKAAKKTVKAKNTAKKTTSSKPKKIIKETTVF
jgi:hypothetical protein